MGSRGIVNLPSFSFLKGFAKDENRNLLILPPSSHKNCKKKLLKIAPPIIVGVWSMAVLLWQRFECLLVYANNNSIKVGTYMYIIIYMYIVICTVVSVSLVLAAYGTEWFEQVR